MFVLLFVAALASLFVSVSASVAWVCVVFFLSVVLCAFEFALCLSVRSLGERVFVCKRVLLVCLSDCPSVRLPAVCLSVRFLSVLFCYACSLVCLLVACLVAF